MYLATWFIALVASTLIFNPSLYTSLGVIFAIAFSGVQVISGHFLGTLFMASTSYIAKQILPKQNSTPTQKPNPSKLKSLLYTLAYIAFTLPILAAPFSLLYPQYSLMLTWGKILLNCNGFIMPIATELFGNLARFFDTKATKYIPEHNQTALHIDKKIPEKYQPSKNEITNYIQKHKLIDNPTNRRYTERELTEHHYRYKAFAQK